MDVLFDLCASFGHNTQRNEFLTAVKNPKVEKITLFFGRNDKGKPVCDFKKTYKSKCTLM